jgi:threonine dehydrogenase-like Zn-dependent dehydrogenase
MECFYCKNGYTSRCEESLLLGCGKLDGAQAEYIRVPFADGSVMKAPPEISDNALVLMADIFPTGFFGAKNAFNGLAQQPPSEATAVVIGCGPVGLCAIIAALEYKPKHLFAIDSVDSRLDLARSLGAEPLNFAKDKDGMMARIKEVTDGRGADVVIEVVGLSPALRTAFDILRPFGFISSIGVHNGEVRSSWVPQRAVLTSNRSHGVERKRTAKTSGSKWDVAQCGQYFLKLSSYWRGSRTFSGKSSISFWRGPNIL